MPILPLKYLLHYPIIQYWDKADSQLQYFWLIECLQPASKNLLFQWLHGTLWSINGNRVNNLWNMQLQWLLGFACMHAVFSDIMITVCSLFFLANRRCSCPSAPAFGYVTRCSTSSVTYNCRSGYRLSGSSSRVCLSTGRWSGTAPRCIRSQTSGQLTKYMVHCKQLCTHACNDQLQMSAWLTNVIRI